MIRGGLSLPTRHKGGHRVSQHFPTQPNPGFATIALRSLVTGVIVTDFEGMVLEANNAAPLFAATALGSMVWELGDASTALAVRRAFDRALAGSAVTEHVTVTHHDATNETLITWQLEIRATKIGQLVVFELRDVSDAYRLQQALNDRTRELAESAARFRALAESTSDLVCLHDPEGRFEYLSPSLSKLLGYESRELIGTHPEELVHSNDREHVGRRFRMHAAAGIKPIEFQYRIRRRGGTYTWFETILTSIVSQSGQVVQLQSSSRDITERKRTEAELVRLAFHDELTGLPTRALLLDRIGQALAVSRRTN